MNLHLILMKVKNKNLEPTGNIFDSCEKLQILKHKDTNQIKQYNKDATQPKNFQAPLKQRTER